MLESSMVRSAILFASIFPVLIAILPYINPQIETYKYSFILFYDSKDKKLTTGGSWNHYASNYLNLFTYVSKGQSVLNIDDLSDLQGNKDVDLIEKGIFQTLVMQFLSHWDVDWRETLGPDYVSLSGKEGLLKLQKKFH